MATGVGFGVQATELTNPQAAGSAPLSPVQEPADFVPDLGVVNKVLQFDMKKAPKPWEQQVGEYTKEITGIQQAIDSGSVDARRGATLMRQTTTKYQRSMAGQLEGQKALSEAWKYMNTGSSVEQTVELESSADTAIKNAAAELSKIGIAVPALNEMKPQERYNLLQQYTGIQRLNKIAEDQKEAIKFGNEIKSANRSEAEFYWKQQDHQRQEDSRNALTQVMSSSLSVANDSLKRILDSADSEEEKRLKFTQMMTGLRSKAGELLIGDQASLKMYNDQLDQFNTLGIDMLKPGADLNKLQNELQKRILAQQLDMTSSQAGVKLAAADKLFGNSVAANMGTNQFMTNYMRDDIKQMASGKMMPSLVTGDVGTQKSSFSAVQATIREATSGNAFEPNKNWEQATAATNSVLKSMGAINQNSGVSLEYAKNFFASPEFAEVVKRGGLEQVAMDNAVNTYRDLYVSAFGDNFFTQEINKPLGDVRYEGGKPSQNNATMGRMIDFSVDKNGYITIETKIDPEFRKGISASDMYLSRETRLMRQGYEKKINDMVRAGAHLDGRTDYKQYFEENGWMYLRGILPPPQYIDEYKKQGYKGSGNLNNPANWTGNTGLPSERAKQQQ